MCWWCARLCEVVIAGCNMWWQPSLLAVVDLQLCLCPFSLSFLRCLLSIFRLLLSWCDDVIEYGVRCAMVCIFGVIDHESGLFDNRQVINVVCAYEGVSQWPFDCCVVLSDRVGCLDFVFDACNNVFVMFWRLVWLQDEMWYALHGCWCMCDGVYVHVSSFIFLSISFHIFHRLQ
jgi:hypothetical protein